MDSKNIYGVDLEENITPLMVRDALVRCFFEAHCLDSDLDPQEVISKTNKDYCRAIVTKAFFDVGGDFENPDKDSLSKVINKLSDFSNNFRDKDIIEKHASQINKLLNKL